MPLNYLRVLDVRRLWHKHCLLWGGICKSAYTVQLWLCDSGIHRRYRGDHGYLVQKAEESYSWSEFETVKSYTILTYNGREEWILCSQIPVKEIDKGVTDAFWVQMRPFRVLYIFKMPDEREREFFSYLPRE